jgi:hypothetical protein
MHIMKISRDRAFHFQHENTMNLPAIFGVGGQNWNCYGDLSELLAAATDAVSGSFPTLATTTSSCRFSIDVRPYLALDVKKNIGTKSGNTKHL